MAKKKQKYYVVWEGVNPGIYDNWTDCQLQIKGVAGAKYKAFKSIEEAQEAYGGQYTEFVVTKTKKPKVIDEVSRQKIIWDSISVDAACSGNPGIMEYRGVVTQDASELFRLGPFRHGTNNIGEFLALVHGLAYLQKHQKPNLPIYSDSRTAMAWVRNKKVKTTLKRSRHNEQLFELMERALNWIKNNSYENPIIKWETEKWGEIPADFGRK